MTYNVFNGTLNPTHFTSLRQLFGYRYVTLNFPAFSALSRANGVNAGLTSRLVHSSSKVFELHELTYY